jgi:hypothetical protein
MRGAADSIEITTHATGPRELLAIGIPSFGMVHLYFCARLYNLRMPMNRVVRQFYVVGKEVGEARNELCARALDVGEDGQPERCTHLLFLDDDVLFHPDVLLKLLSHDRPIVSGLYYAKSSVPQPLILHGEFGGTARTWTPGDLVECEGHGMGLCLIRTEVLRRMRDELDLGTDPHGYPAWFRTVKDSPLVRADGVPAIYNSTEDWQFLMRARQLGYQPCVDTSAAAFGWHLDARAMTIYPQRQWTEFQKTGRVTWPLDSGGDAVVWEDAA